MSRLTAIFFVLSLAFLSLFAFAGPVSTFSELENRVLQEMPKVSTQNLLNGNYMRDLTHFVQDQFWQRPWWLQMKNGSDRILGRKDIGQAFLGPTHGVYAEKRPALNEAFFNVNLSTLAELGDWCAERDINSWFLGIYGFPSVYPELLPAYAAVADEGALAQRIAAVGESVKYIDTFNDLIERRQEKLYFHTDHHWTARGAYAGYLSLMRGLDLSPKPLEEFDTGKAEGFLGTLFSRAPLFGVAAEEVEYFWDPQAKVAMSYGDSAELNSLLVMENATKKDKYTIFLGGVQPQVVIRSDISNGRRLLILKDSFAHPLTPFLTSHFEEIHLLDLRYFKSSVRDYILERQVTDLLCAYNLSWFAADIYFGALD